MPGLDASAAAADSTACCSVVGKHTGGVSSILGASLEPAQRRYNKSTLYSREETTEREYCCKKSVTEISTSRRSPARYGLQWYFLQSLVLFFEKKPVFMIFFYNQDTLELIDKCRKREVPFTLLRVWLMFNGLNYSHQRSWAGVEQGGHQIWGSPHLLKSGCWLRHC